MKPWRKQEWCIPRRGGGDWVACLEDVLAVYCRPYDASRPQICLDEAAKQLLSEVVAAEPMEPGKPTRQDYHYERQGGAVCLWPAKP